MRFDFFKNEKKQEWLVVVALLALLVSLLIPTFYIGRYSFRQADDFAYADTVWKETHSFLKSFSYEFRQSIRLYHDWQGLYLSNFLFLLVQTFLADDFYFLTPIIAIISLIISEIFASKMIFSDLLNSSFRRSLLISLPIIIFQISVPVSASEAYYWLCSVISYTLMFSLYAFFSAYILKSFFLSKLRGKSFFFTMLGCFFIAGINYMFSLPFACFLFLLVLYSFLKKKKDLCYRIISLFVIYIFFFCLNVFSPGARARQVDAANLSINPLKAIMLSFSSAVEFISDYWHLPLTLLALALIPLFIKISSENKFTFRKPWIFSIVSFSLFSSQFTPCLYALGIIGAYRVQNIYLFTMLIFVLGNIFFWVGFICQKVTEKHLQKKEAIRKPSKFTFSTLITSSLAFLIIFYVSFYKVYGYSMTPFSAYRSIKQGEAEAYYQQWQERLELLNDDSIKECEFEPYVNAPYTLFFQDLTDNKIAWQSPAEGMALYYGKTSIKLKEKED